MSIMDRSLEQAKQLGINPLEPISEKGMGLVLKKAETFGLVTYRQGMSADWLDSLALYAHTRNSPIPAFQEILAAVFYLSTTAEQGFRLPKHFWEATFTYRKERYRQALGDRQFPELPPEWSGTSDLVLEQGYYKAFRQAAIVTGEYEQATRIAREKCGLPAETLKQIYAKPPKEAVEAIQKLSMSRKNND